MVLVVVQLGIESLAHGHGGRLQPSAVVHAVSDGMEGFAPGHGCICVYTLLLVVGAGVAALVGTALALVDGAHAIESAGAGFGHGGHLL